MNDAVIIQFFDNTKPCPEQIPFCKELREAYDKEIQKASNSGCTQCQKLNIKSKYISAIWTKTISSLISKASS